MEVLSDLFKGAVSAFAGGGSSNAVLQTIGNGSATTFNVTHSLATRDVEAAVYRNASPWDKVYVQTERPDINTVRFVFDTAPASNAFRAMVWQPSSGGAAVSGNDAFLSTIGNASATTFNVTHGLNTRDIEVAVYRAVTPWDRVYPYTERLDLNTVKIVFETAPASNEFRVIVWEPGSGGGSAGGGADPGDLAALEARVLQREKVDPTDIIPLPLDGVTSITDNLFSHNAQDEYAYGLTGQDTLLDPGISLAASTLQAYFGLPTEDSTVRQHYPFIDLGGGSISATTGNVTTGYRNIPLSHITVRMFNSPLHHNLFDIAGFAGRAITAFKYTGGQPLHTVLDGYINLLVRVGDVGSGTANTKLRTTVYLRNDVKPAFDEDDDQTLGLALGSGDLPTIQLTASEFTDGNGSTDAATVTSGAWLKKSIAIKRLVNFQPGSTYRLVLVASLISGDYKPVEWGFRIESGGLSCALDGSQILKRAIKNIMIAGV